MLLLTGSLVAAPAAAWAQGAADPFEQTGTGQAAATVPTDMPPLTLRPQGEGTGGDRPTPSPPDPTATRPEGEQATNAPRVRQLPQTGLDTRTVLLLGLALTLAGVGLRLRTADARF